MELLPLVIMVKPIVYLNNLKKKVSEIPFALADGMNDTMEI